MTDNYFRSKEIKIRVPRILDDPLVGRVLTLPLFFPYNLLGTDYKYIIVQKGKLILHGSALSGRKTISFQLENIDKFILRKREISCFDRAGKLNFWGRSGIELELSLVDVEGKNYVIIPIFLTNFLVKTTKKIWEHFLEELCRYSGLSLEETILS